MKFSSTSLPLLLTSTYVFAAPTAIPPNYHVDFKMDIVAVSDFTQRTFLLHLEKALKGVYMPAMLAAVHNPSHIKATFALSRAFGKDFFRQMSTIKTNIERISNYHATVGRITEELPADWMASYEFDKREIWLAPKFYSLYKGEPWTRAQWNTVMRRAAPMLIHEISHAILNTVDDFRRSDFKPDIHDTDHNSYSGYLHHDYKRIRAHGAATQVHNADAYFVFAHLAVHGDEDVIPHETIKSEWDFNSLSWH